MKLGSRHSSPLLVPAAGPPLVLQRVILGRDEDDGGWRERRVQDLVHEYPDIIPMAEIEPAFAPLISICTELPSVAGFLDNLWMTPAGGLVLGECKLVRNPQARREVIAQALDYARALSAWNYEELETAVRSALHDKAASIWGIVGPHSSLTEAEFVDAVQRRLRLGRFLVLIIGDGIQEGVEALTSFLQLHAGLHTGLALVDLSIWKGAGDALIVVPRIPMRTVLIERGVVTADPALGVTVRSPEAVSSPGVPRPPRAVSVSEPEFYDQLELHRPEMASRVQAFLSSAAELGVQPEFRRTLILRAPVGSEMITLATVDNYARVWFGSAWGSANRIGQAPAADAYLAAVAALVGGKVKTYVTATPPEVLGPDGKSVELVQLLAATDRWSALIGTFIEAAADRRD